MLFIILLTISFLIGDEIAYESIRLLSETAILFELAGIILIDHLSGRFNTISLQNSQISIELLIELNKVFQ